MPVYRFSIRAVTDSELSSQVPGAVSINASGPDVYIDVDALVGSFNDLNAFMQSKGFVYVATDPVTTPANAGSATINHNQLLNLSSNDHPQYQLTSEKGAANGYAGLDASSLIALANIPVIDDTKHGSRGGGSLHSAATTSVAGFMSSTDKTKLDGIATGATNTPLTASAPANVTKATAVVGVATDAARADHKHDITTAAAVTLSVGGANAEGTATSLARSDHTHALPAFGTTAGTFAQGNDSRFTDDRTASGLRTATTIVAISSATAPTTGQFLVATSGTAATWQTISITPTSRTLTAGAGLTGGGDLSADRTFNVVANADGSIIVNADDIQVGILATDSQHGNRGGGALHSLATTSVAGFMSGTDKTKLDGIATNATNTPLSSTAPADVTKATAVIGASSTAARSDHKHDISTAAASSLSATTTNTEGTATSLARSDHTHAISSAAPSALTVGGSNTIGTSSSFARADHIHALPAFGTTAGTFTEGNDSRLSDARTPTAHAVSHQDGGSDEISVAGLSGQLADAQKVTVRVNSGSDLGPQARLNFIAGTNITLSGVNDGPNNEVDITINASGGSGSGDVVGPASATDNAIVRFDGTTGKLVQDSLITIGDDGSLVSSGPYFQTTAQTNAPSPSTTGNVRIYGRNYAGRSMIGFIGPSGLSSILQTSFARNAIGFARPYGNATTLSVWAMAITATGTATTANVAVTNIHTQIKRLDYLVTTASTSAVAGFRYAAAQLFRGANPGQGGFHVTIRWGPATGVATATNRCFVGIRNSTSAPTDVNPSTLPNILGMGWDSTDTNIQFFHNDGAGTATKIDLGTLFPRPTLDRTNAYEISIFSPQNGSNISFAIEDLGTGAVATGSVNTNIPTNTTLLTPCNSYMSVGGTSSVIGITLMGVYFETDQ